MSPSFTRTSMVLLIIGVMLMASLVFAQHNSSQIPDPNSAVGPGATKVTRGGAPDDKLSMELQVLYRQLTTTRGLKPYEPTFSDSELSSLFGIKSGEKNPSVEVALQTNGEVDTAVLEKAGARIRLRAGNMVYASVPVRALQRLARESNVTSMEPMMGAHIPRPPNGRLAPQLVRGRTRGERLVSEFDPQTLTGKGVVVAIIDTGIDWSHQDFIKEDGTSRILYLYDLFDDSWTNSKGRIGSQPPLMSSDNKPLGTLYTNAQLNAALRGQGTIASRDVVGHGTACAGTAGGNGRATARGIPAKTYKGIAPDADLIIVKAEDGDGGISGLGYYTVDWILKTTKSLGKPCVISMSFGSHASSHEGDAPPERLLDDLVGENNPGAAICVSAGNEGRDSFHAGGTFGPDRPGQGDRFSREIELFISSETALNSYFSTSDDWGLAIVGMDNFFVDEQGQPVVFYLSRIADKISSKLSRAAKAPGDLNSYFKENVEVKPVSNNTYRATVWLQPGKYIVVGYGASANVMNGRFDLYLPNSKAGSFGKGNEARFMVGSPGNAANVITVGAYDFRGAWGNTEGTQTIYNLTPGTLSDYSSPGFRRDNVVKPEIAAPATYTISPLSKDSVVMGRTSDGEPDKAAITLDGFHLAWAGTSASSPYTAGVIALMLQKNPGLHVLEIKDILKKTAIKDSFTGATPNPQWGYGKLNPAAAIAATPSARPSLRGRTRGRR